MVKRATKEASRVFGNVLHQAQQKLFLNAAAAENFDHRGLKGGERAVALADFLKGHLPGVFGVGSGEAIDYRDNRTGELDIFIYDRSTAAPIQASNESLLVPAEAVYAVIEVKSVLSQTELDVCLKAAKRVRDLRPFKGRFIAAPTGGETHVEHYRCPYYVFAYRSDLGQQDWARKELNRVKLAAQKVQCDSNLLDRVLVLDRGMLHPQASTALTGDDSTGVFLEFYINLINFLTRERTRRPVIDWTAYTSRKTWTKLA